MVSVFSFRPKRQWQPRSVEEINCDLDVKIQHWMFCVLSWSGYRNATQTQWCWVYREGWLSMCSSFPLTGIPKVRWSGRVSVLSDISSCIRMTCIGCCFAVFCKENDLFGAKCKSEIQFVFHLCETYWKDWVLVAMHYNKIYFATKKKSCLNVHTAFVFLAGEATARATVWHAWWCSVENHCQWSERTGGGGGGL